MESVITYSYPEETIPEIYQKERPEEEEVKNISCISGKIKFKKGDSDIYYITIDKKTFPIYINSTNFCSDCKDDIKNLYLIKFTKTNPEEAAFVELGFFEHKDSPLIEQEEKELKIKALKHYDSKIYEENVSIINKKRKKYLLEGIEFYLKILREGFIPNESAFNVVIRLLVTPNFVRNDFCCFCKEFDKKLIGYLKKSEHTEDIMSLIRKYEDQLPFYFIHECYGTYDTFTRVWKNPT